MSRLLSIIIPTRNRYEYLYFCLLSLIENYNSLNIEIILHDNSTDIMPVNVKEIINSNSIIKYYQIKGWISACENIEKAVGMSTGQYITMIGDDDSLSKYLLDAVDFMKANDVDALNSPFAHYIWPDIQSRLFKSSFSGKMEILKFNGKFKEINIENQIEKLLNMGGTSLVQLPRIYYGIVKRDLIEKVKESSGSYIPGPSPDMANAVSMSMFTKKNYFVDIPLFIAGNSSKSTAGMGAKGEHIGKIEEIPFLPKDCATNWSKLVPRYWSGPTIWAESALKALEKSGGQEFVPRFNYIRLYANCLVFNSLWNRATWITFNEYIKVFNRSRQFALIQLYFYVFLIWTVRFRILARNVLKIINNRISKRNRIYHLDNVYLAAEKLNNELKIVSNSFFNLTKK